MTANSEKHPADRSLRLVVVSEEFSGTISGGAHVRHSFCQLASEWGHDVTVLTTRGSGAPRRETVEGINVVRLTPDSPDSTQGMSLAAIAYRILFSLAVFVFLVAWTPRNQIDGLHSASSACHWATKLASVLFDVPVVNFLGLTQSATSTKPSVFTDLLERVNFGLFMGDVVFCRNSQTRDLVSKYASGEVKIVHGILNRTKVQDAMERTPSVNAEGFVSSDADYVITYIGRLVPIKNPTGSIDVLEQLPTEYELVIVGDGPDRDAVEHQAGRTNGRVHVVGRLPHDQTLDAIATADAVILTSHAESYSAVVLEALALGTDVFARPVGVVPSLDHERLHVADQNNLSALIRETSLNGSDPDEDILEQYSMGRYTRDIIKVHQRLAS